MKTAIITDSTCDLSAELKREHDIFFIPLKVIYKDSEYDDILEISPEEITERLDIEVPKTSLPKPQMLQDLFDQLVADGYQRAVGVFLSSGVSGTYNMACQLFELEDRLETKIYDSKAISAELALIAMELSKAIKAGADWQNLDNVYAEIRERTFCVFMLDTLKYLQIGGRIGSIEGTIGEILNVKPILSINRDDGTFFVYKKCRGRKKGIDALLKLVESYAPKPVRIMIGHSSAYEEADKLKALIEEKFDYAQVDSIVVVSSVITTHAGPGILGLAIQEQ